MVNAIWYETTEEIDLNKITTITTNKNEAVQPINARSQIECVLKCKTQFHKDAFFSNENSQCFCLQGVERNKLNNKISQENQNSMGKLTNQHPMESRGILL